MLVVALSTSVCYSTMIHYEWKPEHYEQVRNYLRAGSFDKAYQLVNLFPLLSDSNYWSTIPNVVYTGFNDDPFKLYVYADRLYQAGYRNNRLYHMYTRRLIELDNMMQARELIMTVERIGSNGTDELPIKSSNRHREMKTMEFLQILFAKASSDHNMHLFGVCQAILEKYASKHPKSVECRWYYAKTLVKLNDLESAVREFKNLTHYNNVGRYREAMIKNIHWKSCIEFGNLLMQINGSDAVWASRQNPFLWALNRIKYQKAETMEVLEGSEYYKRRFVWIRRRVDLYTFIKLLNELCRRYPHDKDAQFTRKKYFKKMERDLNITNSVGTDFRRE